MHSFPRTAQKIVGTADQGYDLMLKFPDTETVVTVAHMLPGSNADIYAQAFACCPPALHLIEDAIDMAPAEIERDPPAGLLYAMRVIAAVRPDMLASHGDEE